MGFINDVMNKLGIPPESRAGGYTVNLYDGVGLFVEGHKGILAYTSECIEIRIKREKLIVTGEGLRIIEINQTELYIKGKIISTAVSV